jgi:hypothetical protein
MAAKKPPRQNSAPEADRALVNPHAHLIRIADLEARKRAVMALGEVGRPYCGFTDFRFLVTNEHLDVLRREEIPFEALS